MTAHAGSVGSANTLGSIWRICPPPREERLGLALDAFGVGNLLGQPAVETWRVGHSGNPLCGQVLFLCVTQPTFRFVIGHGRCSVSSTSVPASSSS